MLHKVKSILINSDKTITSNMIISGVCKPISMIISYIYIPVVLDYLGIEKYGIWSTILMILSWISYFDIGIGNGLRNKLTESLSKKDNKSRKLISSAYAFITVIMIIIAIVFAAVASFVNWNRVFGVDNIEENLVWVIIISVGFVVVNFILSICKNVLYALQKAADISVMEIMVQILNLCGVLFAMQFLQGNLFIMALIYGISMTIVNLTASVFIYGKNKDIRPGFKEIDRKIGRSIANLGIQFFVIQICALVLFMTDSLIISYLYGAADVTPYNIVNKLFQVIIGIYSAMLAPIWSAVTKAKTENRIEDIRQLLKKLHFIMLILNICAIILAFVMKPVTSIWLRKELEYSKELIIFGCLYCILNNWCNLYAYVSNGLEIMKISMFLAIIQASVNIPISLFMAEILKMRSAGVLGGTVISMMIAAVVLPLIVNNKLRTLEKLGEHM